MGEHETYLDPARRNQDGDEPMSDNAAQDIRDFVTASVVVEPTQVMPPPSQLVPPGFDTAVRAIVREELAALRMPEFMSPQEAARRLNMPPGTVHRLLDQGVIESRKVGRSRKILVASLREYMSKLPPWTE